MGSSAELTLDCRPSAAESSSPRDKSIPFTEDQLERIQRLEEHVKALEDEQRKIEAFKRELPLCMKLLTDAIEASKERLANSQSNVPLTQQRLQISCSYDADSNYRSTSERPVLEEFIPLKRKTDDSGKGESDEDNRDSTKTNGSKPDWMTVAHLWNHQREIGDHGQERVLTIDKASGLRDDAAHGTFNSSSKLFLHSKGRTGGAFLPFTREKKVIQSAVRYGADNLPELAISAGDQDASQSLRIEESGSVHNPARGRSREGIEQQGTEMLMKSNLTATTGVRNNLNHAGGQSQRKSRRCWSPELHRRFVNALQQLGGSQVATPKQIRELMKVDGLTNDEVKSHLQKYRLHTRRLSPVLPPGASHAPQLVVLGGIWVPPEYAAHAAAVAAQQGPALYNSTQQPHVCSQSLPQDFYSQMNSSNQFQLHPSIYYDQQRAAAAHSQNSPQGPSNFGSQLSGGAHVSGDTGREESVGEDGKSESSTWKGEHREERMNEADNGDQRSLSVVLPVSKRHCQHDSEQDDTDAEDSRGSETVTRS
eukprot:c23627_g1_i2 orf=497-2107(+)